MKIRTLFEPLAMLMLFSAVAFGQFFPDYFLPQHFRPADPQMAAMGLTGVAHRGGVLAAYASPAGIADVDRLQIAYTRHQPHWLLFAQRNIAAQNTVAAAIPIYQGMVVGVAYWNFELGEGETTDINGYTTKKYDIGYREYQLTPAVRVPLFSNITVQAGANIKHLKFYFFDEIRGWLYDLGVRVNYDLSRHRLSVGASVHNLGDDLKSKEQATGVQRGDDFKPYRWFKVGAAFGNTDPKLSHSSNIAYLISIEYQKSLKPDKSNLFNGYSKWEALNAGLELRFFKHLFGQIGYVNDVTGSYDEPYDIDGLTYGFGFETPEPLKLVVPVTLSIMYGRSVRLAALNMDTFSVLLGVQL